MNEEQPNAKPADGNKPAPRQPKPRAAKNEQQPPPAPQQPQIAAPQPQQAPDANMILSQVMFNVQVAAGEGRLQSVEDVHQTLRDAGITDPMLVTLLTNQIVAMLQAAEPEPVPEPAPVPQTAPVQRVQQPATMQSPPAYQQGYQNQPAPQPAPVRQPMQPPQVAALQQRQQVQRPPAAVQRQPTQRPPAARHPYAGHPNLTIPSDRYLSPQEIVDVLNRVCLDACRWIAHTAPGAGISISLIPGSMGDGQVLAVGFLPATETEEAAQVTEEYQGSEMATGNTLAAAIQATRQFYIAQMQGQQQFR